MESRKDMYQRDGVVVLRQVFTKEQIQDLATAVELNMKEPGEMASDYTDPPNPGRYFGDYCNFKRLPTLERIALSPALGSLTAELMETDLVQFFHEHILVKEPHTENDTPWHHDQPYYIAEGNKTLSWWVPLDPVEAKVCPRFIKGSHLWPGLFRPRKFKNGSDYDNSQALQPIPDDISQLINQQQQRQGVPTTDPEQTLLMDDLAVGDAIAFHFKTLHCAPPNRSTQRRRVVSLRYLGADVRWKTRAHTPSPPYPEMGLRLEEGDKMPEDWFPVVFKA